MDKLFEVHMLNEQGKLKATIIAAAFDNLLAGLTDMCAARLFKRNIFDKR